MFDSILSANLSKEQIYAIIIHNFGTTPPQEQPPRSRMNPAPPIMATKEVKMEQHISKVKPAKGVKQSHKKVKEEQVKLEDEQAVARGYMSDMVSDSDHDTKGQTYLLEKLLPQGLQNMLNKHELSFMRWHRHLTRQSFQLGQLQRMGRQR